MSPPTCAYCGLPAPRLEREHVFPRCLYPKSKAQSKVQRLTVPACTSCNNSWADDEAHFRNVLVVAGDPPNLARHELWKNKVLPSFDQPDGARRINDLLEIMKSAQTQTGEREMVYPAEDERVLRVVRKVIRGLSHYHGLASPVPDSNVWVDVLRFRIPDYLLDKMEHHHREKDIAEYRFEITSDPPIVSTWAITFYERVTFVGMLTGAGEFT